MSEPEAVPVFEESHTTAALDCARIAARSAAIFVATDPRLSEAERERAIESLNEASDWLDHARMCFPQTAMTSVHVVPAEERRIITPS